VASSERFCPRPFNLDYAAPGENANVVWPRLQPEVPVFTPALPSPCYCCRRCLMAKDEGRFFIRRFWYAPCRPIVHATAAALLVCLSILSAGHPPGKGSPMIVLSKADSGRHIVLQCGEAMQIELPELGGTGYLWQFDCLNREFFDLIGLETVTEKQKEGFTGGPVLKRWRLRAKKTGDTVVRSTRRRGLMTSKRFRRSKSSRRSERGAGLDFSEKGAAE